MPDKKNPLKKMSESRQEMQTEPEGSIEVDPEMVVAVLSAKILEIEGRLSKLEEALNDS